MTVFRPHRDDVFIAVVGLLGGVLLWSLGLYTQQDERIFPAWAALVPLTVICFQTLFRRVLPLTTLAVATAALLADRFTVGNLVTILLFTDGVYAAVVYGSPKAARRIPVITGLLTVAATAGLLAYIRQPVGLAYGVFFGLVTFGPATTGAIIRNHREAAQAAKLRAEQTALLAEMDRAQAVTAERSRMARELHDMVANHLSAIAIHSTAALSLDDPGTTRTALGVIRENSVAGLAEMRRLIGLLRDNSDDREPSARPTLAGLGALVEQARSNGAASGFTFVLDDRRGPSPAPARGSGTPAEEAAPGSVTPETAPADTDPRSGREPGPDTGAAPGTGTGFSTGTGPGSGPEGRPAVPAPVELAAYRIVQESLTNALKHAESGEVRVTLTHSAGRDLTVTVTSPFGSRTGPRAPGSGAGLVGMRERVALLDGAFEAGPAQGPAGGPEKIWRVRAVLPVRDDKEPSA
ncbi:sensor histidine kinase [Streptomyces sp. NPDC051018]|uniref:sensor histidine kinase n=1 Tax=Streptomyces sp. NPDC051018 TaxID=3365639 RepID=UPI0037AC90DE